MNIQIVKKYEYEEVLRFVIDVFMKYDYEMEGVTNFRKDVLENSEYLESLTTYGAYEGDILIGVLAIKDEGHHIGLFFVDDSYRRQKVGTELFWYVLYHGFKCPITVNSLPYGVEFYHKLGFVNTDSEQNVDGIRFTPMKFECPCKRIKCSRYRECVECQIHHKEKGNLPTCERLWKKNNK